jgi:molecular chaperone DnaK
MVKDAQAHADEDRQRQEEIEARNRADALIYSTEKTLAENKDKIPAAETEAAQNALAATRKALDEGGKERIESAVQELTKASHRLAEVLYRSASASDAGVSGDETGGGSPGAGKGEGDVIDAEVVDKK